MPNVINYATKYGKAFDQAVTQEALTSELETPNVDWTGAKTFTESRVTTSGYGNHNRNGGYNSGTVTTERPTYTLGFDRDIEFFVDKADVDESNNDASAENVTEVFVKEQAVPEVDAYRFSKMATHAITESNTVDETITEVNVFGVLKKAILPMRKYGASNLRLYVSSTVMDALERSTVFARIITTEKIADIETRVTSLDGVKIIEVWSEERFYTAFDFTSGFVPAATAKKINFLLVAKTAIIAKGKFNSIYLFQPGQHTYGDGYLYQNRLYHDLFIREHKADGVYVSCELPPGAPLGASSKLTTTVNVKVPEEKKEANKIVTAEHFEAMTLDEVKMYAKENGIEFQGNIGKEKLIEKVMEAVQKHEEDRVAEE